MPAELSRLEISPVKSSKVQNAFTLVELLVVVSIIGLLAGFLIPAIQGGLAAARKAESASQLKQLGTLAVAYTTESGGNLPEEAAKVCKASVNFAKNRTPGTMCFLRWPVS